MKLWEKADLKMQKKKISWESTYIKKELSTIFFIKYVFNWNGITVLPHVASFQPFQGIFLSFPMTSTYIMLHSQAGNFLVLIAVTPCIQIQTLDPFWYFVCPFFQVWPFCIGKTCEQILAVFTMVLYCNDHSCSGKIMGREGNLRNSFGGH